MSERRACGIIVPHRTNLRTSPVPGTYYVDEAGDGILFGRKGRCRLNDPGASQFFMLGMVRCRDDSDAAAALLQLRDELLSHPLCATFHSLRTTAQKTARSFHAKDDHPLPVSSPRHAQCGRSWTPSSAQAFQPQRCRRSGDSHGNPPAPESGSFFLLAISSSVIGPAVCSTASPSATCDDLRSEKTSLAAGHAGHFLEGDAYGRRRPCGRLGHVPALC